MAKHKSCPGPVGGVQIGPRKPRRRLHLEHSHLGMIAAAGRVVIAILGSLFRADLLRDHRPFEVARKRCVGDAEVGGQGTEGFARRSAAD
jgi:hypothetical protein